jgi:hypothetical protein
VFGQATLLAMVAGSPAWKPVAMLAELISGMMCRSSPSPICQGPKLSPCRRSGRLPVCTCVLLSGMSQTDTVSSVKAGIVLNFDGVPSIILIPLSGQTEKGVRPYMPCLAR